MADDESTHKAAEHEHRAELGDDVDGPPAGDGEAGNFVEEDDHLDESDTQDDPPGQAKGSSPISLPDLNRLMVGELIVHFAERDVRVVLDGDAALRTMAIFAGSTNRQHYDVLDPASSPAQNGWFVLDTATPLAMTWLPGLPAPRQRTTIDPAPLAA